MSIWKFTFSNINTPETSCSILLEGWINAIHWINLYKLDGIIGFPNSYLLDSDLSGDRAIQRLNNQSQSITLYSVTRDMLYASCATWFHGFCAKTDHFINLPLHFRLSILLTLH